MIQRNGSVRWNTEKWKSAKLNRKKKERKSKGGQFKRFLNNPSLLTFTSQRPQKEKGERKEKIIYLKI